MSYHTRMDRISNSLSSFQDIFDIESSELKGMSMQEKVGLMSDTIADLNANLEHHTPAPLVGERYRLTAFDEHARNFMVSKGLAKDLLPIGTECRVSDIVKSKLVQQSPPKTLIDSQGHIWELVQSV